MNIYDDTCFSDEEFHDTYHDPDKFVVIGNKRATTRIIVNSKEDVSKINTYSSNDQIFDCFHSMKRYVDDNYVCLLDKCTERDFYDFIKNY